MTRLRRLVLTNRYFFVTCNLSQARRPLEKADFEALARAVQARRDGPVMTP